MDTVMKLFTKNTKAGSSTYKFWKIFLGICFVGLLSQCQPSQEKKEYPRHVGDIAFDAGLDDPNFKVCNEALIFQYYNFSNGLQYRGEKTAIYNAFSTYQVDTIPDQNGYVTIRFVVNCEGETGRFRIETMNNDYEAFQFNRDIVRQLKEVTRSLSGWEIAVYDGEPKDYYQYLTFKIQNGQIVNILP